MRTPAIRKTKSPTGPIHEDFVEGAHFDQCILPAATAATIVDQDVRRMCQLGQALRVDDLRVEPPVLDDRCHIFRAIPNNRQTGRASVHKGPDTALRAPRVLYRRETEQNDPRVKRSRTSDDDCPVDGDDEGRHHGKHSRVARPHSIATARCRSVPSGGLEIP
jgi:hypothetical protein